MKRLFGQDEIYNNEFRFGYQHFFEANILYSLSLNKVLDAFYQLKISMISL